MFNYRTDAYEYSRTFSRTLTSDFNLPQTELNAADSKQSIIVSYLQEQTNTISNELKQIPNQNMIKTLLQQQTKQIYQEINKQKQIQRK